MKNLEEQLELHKLWLKGEQGGVLLDLGGANLSDANLRSANLRSANLIGANLSDANLSDADLSDADLSDADLSDANLRSANLRGANLSDANLSDANLSDANLGGANLRGANLGGTHLRGADLIYCIGNNKEIKSLQIGEYLISYHKNILNIGCQSYTLLEWESFTDIEINNMDTNALDWWNLNKHIIFELVKREI